MRSARRLVTGSCVIRETTHTGCPCGLGRAFLYLYLSIPSLSLANKEDPRDLSIEPSYVDAHEDARDEEMLAARRAIKEAEAARPRDRTRVFEACEACEEIRKRKQGEREMRVALGVASIPFEAEQQAFASDEKAGLYV